MGKTISHIKQSLDLNQRARIDNLALQFENAWKSGQPPRLERYLTSKHCDATIRPALLEELLALEIEYCVRGGQRPLLAEYQTRFPDEVTLVTGVFRDVCPSLLDVSSDATQSGLAEESSTDVSGADASGTSGGAVDTPLDVSLPDGLSRYKILRELGEGSFGRVLLAEDLTLGTLAAIKISRRDLFMREQDVSRFLREARIAAPLKYDNIARVYDVGRDGDLGCYIVMDYIDGGSLDVQEAASRMSFRERASLIAKIARAIHRAHTDGLVHRDLKPDNILLDSQGAPFVADFGMALHEQEQRKRSGEFAGTLAYMSPEQVRGYTQFLDGRTDIWSLGVVLYELLTGRRPFAGETEERLSEEILRRDPRPPRQVNDAIPSQLEEICLRALKRQPQDRFPTALDFAQALESAIPDDVVAPVVVTARPRPTPPPAPPRGRLAQREPVAPPGRTSPATTSPGRTSPGTGKLRWALIGSAVGLLLILVIAMAFWPDGKPPPIPSPVVWKIQQRKVLISTHADRFTSLAMSQPANPDQRSIVAAGDRLGNVCVWDWRTGAPLHSHYQAGPVSGVCLSRDGRLLVVRWAGNDTLYVYDLLNGIELAAPKVASTTARLATADDPSRVWLVQGDGAKIDFQNVERSMEVGLPERTLPSPLRQNLQIAAHDSLLAVAGYDPASRRWGVAIDGWGTELPDVGPVCSVALAHARRFAIGGFAAGAGVQVQLNGTAGLTKLEDPAEQSLGYHCVAFSDNDSVLVDVCRQLPSPDGSADSFPGFLRLWDLKDLSKPPFTKQFQGPLSAVVIDFPYIVLAFEAQVEVWQLSGP